MTTGIRTVIYPVADLARAKALFGALLGADPVVDAPYYAQFDADGQAIGLDPHGHRHGQSGPVAYWHAADVAESLTALIRSTATSSSCSGPLQDPGCSASGAPCRAPHPRVAGRRVPRRSPGRTGGLGNGTCRPPRRAPAPGCPVEFDVVRRHRSAAARAASRAATVSCATSSASA